MKHAKAVRRIIFTVLIVAAVIVGFNTYTADYYHAKDYELQTTEVSETDAYIAYGDPQSETGLIFYPPALLARQNCRPVRAKALKLQAKHKAFALSGRLACTHYTQGDALG